MVKKDLLDHAARTIGAALVAGKTGRAYAIRDQLSADIVTMMQKAKIPGEAKSRGLAAIGFDDRTAAKGRRRR